MIDAGFLLKTWLAINRKLSGKLFTFFGKVWLLIKSK